MRHVRIRFLAAMLSVLATGACSTARKWQEMTVGGLNFAQVYDTVESTARTQGFTPSPADCDRGLGTFQTRWREHQIGLDRPGRFRLVVTIDDRESASKGWLVRWYIEQEKVKDLSRGQRPRDSDWSGDGQDGEREYLFGEQLRRSLRAAPDASKAK
jgi:hypothetical protein